MQCLIYILKSTKTSNAAKVQKSRERIRSYKDRHTILPELHLVFSHITNTPPEPPKSRSKFQRFINTYLLHSIISKFIAQPSQFEEEAELGDGVSHSSTTNSNLTSPWVFLWPPAPSFFRSARMFNSVGVIMTLLIETRMGVAFRVVVNRREEPCRESLVKLTMLLVSFGDRG
jgi:hypothetical protein